MANNVGVAFGTIADVFGQHFAEKKKQEHDDEQNRIRMVSDLVSSSLKSGNIKNPNETFQFLLDTIGGKGGGKGKGGKKGELPGPLKTILGATQQAAGNGSPESTQTLGGQDRPSFQPPQPQGPQAQAPQFFTPEEQAKSAADAEVNLKKRISSEVTLPEKKAESDLKLKEYEARFGAVDPETLKRAKQLAVAAGDTSENFPNYLQPAAKAIGDERTQKQNLSKYPAAMRERISELVARGIPEDRAPAVASQQMAAERVQKQQQATTRLNASLQMSRASLLSSTERLAEMKELFPHVLAAKIAGEEIANLRPEVVRQQLEKGAQALAKGAASKPDVAAQKEAAKIVEAATKLASSKAAKQNFLAMGLGIDDDEATIRRAYIQELSGGQDPDAVEALAQKASAAPSAPAPRVPAKPAASANPFR